MSGINCWAVSTVTERALRKKKHNSKSLLGKIHLNPTGSGTNRISPRETSDYVLSCDWFAVSWSTNGTRFASVEEVIVGAWLERGTSLPSPTGLFRRNCWCRDVGTANKALLSSAFAQSTEPTVVGIFSSILVWNPWAWTLFIKFHQRNFYV